MDRLVLSHLRSLVSPFQDPLQFANQPKVGVDDAEIYLLQRAYSSLDRLNITVQVMFFDFSSAFNTTQPRLLRAKLENMQMDAPFVSWIEDYLGRRLRSFSVCSRMLHMFYQSVMASTTFFAVACFGAGIKAKDANSLKKLIKKAGSVVGYKLANLDEVVRDRMVSKVWTIMDNPSHPLHSEQTEKQLQQQTPAASQL
ncbi:hypothetical protein D4764_15G0007990 [Takifugu flavidus]|uniref:Reverse transcriptase domain-containing protein n=1 Tax=Takifugu flavidus TaxID=433684 RepID=A0A5C6P267_9TELE|nr:hypothetical protein D4764_15G0007990 [Takifugu flavidus]